MKLKYLALTKITLSLALMSFFAPSTWAEDEITSTTPQYLQDTDTYSWTTTAPTTDTTGSTVAPSVTIDDTTYYLDTKDVARETSFSVELSSTVEDSSTNSTTISLLLSDKNGTLVLSNADGTVIYEADTVADESESGDGEESEVAAVSESGLTTYTITTEGYETLTVTVGGVDNYISYYTTDGETPSDTTIISENSTTTKYYTWTTSSTTKGTSLSEVSATNVAEGTSYDFSVSYESVYTSRVTSITADINASFVGVETTATGTSSALQGGALLVSGVTIDDFDIIGDFIYNSANQPKAQQVYGGAIFITSSSVVDEIIGNFIGNYASNTSTSAKVALGGAIGLSGVTVGSITGDFIGNYAYSAKSYTYGGAIHNTGTKLGSITGDFIGNYAYSAASYSYGGAINNQSAATIGSITGDFISNYVEASTNAYGGAINQVGGTISSVEGDFIGNWATGSGYALGGAIYTSSTISSLEGDFIGNSAYGASTSNLGGAVYAVAGSTTTFTASEGASYSYTDNWAGASLESRSDVNGGFLYAAGTAKIYFDTAANSYITIGYTEDDAENYDSIASDNTNGYIYKTGEGTLTVNSSMANYLGALVIEEGTLAYANSASIGATITVGNDVEDSETTSTLTISASDLTSATTIYADGTLNFSADADISGTLTNDGIVNITDATISGTLSNSGTVNITNATISGTATGSGTINVSESLAITGSLADFEGSLNAASASVSFGNEFGGTLTVDDSSNISVVLNETTLNLSIEDYVINVIALATDSSLANDTLTITLVIDDSISIVDYVGETITLYNTLNDSIILDFTAEEGVESFFTYEAGVVTISSSMSISGAESGQSASYDSENSSFKITTSTFTLSKNAGIATVEVLSVTADSTLTADGDIRSTLTVSDGGTLSFETIADDVKLIVDSEGKLIINTALDLSKKSVSISGNLVFALGSTLTVGEEQVSSLSSISIYIDEAKENASFVNLSSDITENYNVYYLDRLLDDDFYDISGTVSVVLNTNAYAWTVFDTTLTASGYYLAPAESGDSYTITKYYVDANDSYFDSEGSLNSASLAVLIGSIGEAASDSITTKYYSWGSENTSYYAASIGALEVKDSDLIAEGSYDFSITASGTRITSMSDSITQSFAGLASTSAGGAISLSSKSYSAYDITGDFVSNSTTYKNGGAIYMTESSLGNITGNFIANYAYLINSNDNGGAISIVSSSTVNSITGDFIGNYASSAGSGYYARGGAIYITGSTITTNITGDFIGNYVYSRSNSLGGAIYMGSSSSVDSIIGNFIGNYAYKTTNASTFNVGGAIALSASSVESIVGDFMGNAVIDDSGTGATATIGGGAIYLTSSGANIGSITGDFIANYVSVLNYAASTNAGGGAIYIEADANIGSIASDFAGNYASTVNGAINGGAIYNAGEISGNVTGDFIGNYAESAGTYSNGGAIYNAGDITGDITGDFTGNYAESAGNYSKGGAIYNAGTISGDITGDFSGNYAESTVSAYSTGGAIQNTGDITGDITGNFIDNSTIAVNVSRGGAIFNSSSISGTITGNFIGNSTYSSTTSAVKDSQGGAIYNTGTISLVEGDFTDNYSYGVSTTTTQGGAVYNSGEITFKASDTTIGEDDNAVTTGSTYNYTGNWAGISEDDRSDANGGFLYMAGGTATFNVDTNSKITIGYAESDTENYSAGYDSIAGIADSIINKNGAGLLTVNSSMASYEGALNVTAGTFDYTNDAKLNVASLSISSGATLRIDTDALYSSSTVANAGTLELSSGELSVSISGEGDLSLDLTTYNSTDAFISIADTASLAVSNVSVYLSDASATSILLFDTIETDSYSYDSFTVYYTDSDGSEKEYTLDLDYYFVEGDTSLTLALVADIVNITDETIEDLTIYRASGLTGYVSLSTLDIAITISDDVANNDTENTSNNEGYAIKVASLGSNGSLYVGGDIGTSADNGDVEITEANGGSLEIAGTVAGDVTVGATDSESNETTTTGIDSVILGSVAGSTNITGDAETEVVLGKADVEAEGETVAVENTSGDVTIDTAKSVDLTNVSAVTLTNVADVDVDTATSVAFTSDNAYYSTADATDGEDGISINLANVSTVSGALDVDSVTLSNVGTVSDSITASTSVGIDIDTLNAALDIDTIDGALTLGTDGTEYETAVVGAVSVEVGQVTGDTTIYGTAGETSEAGTSLALGTADVVIDGADTVYNTSGDVSVTNAYSVDLTNVSAVTLTNVATVDIDTATSVGDITATDVDLTSVTTAGDITASGDVKLATVGTAGAVYAATSSGIDIDTSIRSLNITGKTDGDIEIASLTGSLSVKQVTGETTVTASDTSVIILGDATEGNVSGDVTITTAASATLTNVEDVTLTSVAKTTIDTASSVDMALAGKQSEVSISNVGAITVAEAGLESTGDVEISNAISISGKVTSEGDVTLTKVSSAGDVSASGVAKVSGTSGTASETVGAVTGASVYLDDLYSAGAVTSNSGVVTIDNVATVTSVSSASDATLATVTTVGAVSATSGNVQLTSVGTAGAVSATSGNVQLTSVGTAGEVSAATSSGIDIDTSITSLNITGKTTGSIDIVKLSGDLSVGQVSGETTVVASTSSVITLGDATEGNASGDVTITTAKSASLTNVEDVTLTSVAKTTIDTASSVDMAAAGKQSEVSISNVGTITVAEAGLESTGDVEISNATSISGKVTSTEGDVTLTKVATAGDVSASGVATVSGTSGTASETVGAVTGASVYLADLAEAGAVTATSGDIEITTASLVGAVTANTVSSQDIALATVTEVGAVRASGNVELTSVGAVTGDISASSSTGIGVSGKVSGTVDIDSVSGAVSIGSVGTDLTLGTDGTTDASAVVGNVSVEVGTVSGVTTIYGTVADSENGTAGTSISLGIANEGDTTNTSGAVTITNAGTVSLTNTTAVVVASAGDVTVSTASSVNLTNVGVVSLTSVSSTVVDTATSVAITESADQGEVSITDVSTITGAIDSTGAVSITSTDDFVTTLEASVNADTITITGIVDAVNTENTSAALTANTLSIASSAYLTTSASNLQAEVTNAGTVELTTGTLSSAISGTSGTVVVTGSVSTSADIEAGTLAFDLSKDSVALTVTEAVTITASEISLSLDSTTVTSFGNDYTSQALIITVADTVLSLAKNEAGDIISSIENVDNPSYDMSSFSVAIVDGNLVLQWAGTDYKVSIDDTDTSGTVAIDKNISVAYTGYISITATEYTSEYSIYISGDVGSNESAGDVEITNASGGKLEILGTVYGSVNIGTTSSTGIDEVLLGVVSGSTLIAGDADTIVVLGDTSENDAVKSGDVTVNTAASVSLSNVEDVILTDVSSTIVNTADSVSFDSTKQDNITLTSVSSVTGDITASASAGLDVDSVTGSVNVDAVAGSVAIGSVSGDVTLGEVSSSTNITATSTSEISLGNATTLSGDVTITTAESATLTNVSAVTLTDVATVEIDTAKSVGDITASGNVKLTKVASAGVVNATGTATVAGTSGTASEVVGDVSGSIVALNDLASAGIVTSNTGAVTVENVGTLTSVSSASDATLATVTTVGDVSATSGNVKLTSVGTAGAVSAATSTGIDIDTSIASLNITGKTTGDIDIVKLSGDLSAGQVTGETTVVASTSSVITLGDATEGNASGDVTITTAASATLRNVGEVELENVATVVVAGADDVTVNIADSVDLSNVEDVTLTTVAKTTVDSATSVDMSAAGNQTSVSITNVGTITGDIVSAGDVTISGIAGVTNTTEIASVTVTGDDATLSLTNIASAQDLTTIKDTSSIELTNVDLVANITVAGTLSITGDTVVSGTITTAVLEVLDLTEVGGDFVVSGDVTNYIEVDSLYDSISVGGDVLNTTNKENAIYVGELSTTDTAGESSAGSIVVYGDVGTETAENGDITIDTANGGTLKVEGTVYGDVNVGTTGDTAGIDSVTLSTVAGATSIVGDAETEVVLGNADTASGDVTISTAASVDLTNVEDVTLSSVASTTIDTASSVDLTSAQDQDSITLTSVDTVTGDITATSSSSLDVGTVSGAISVETVEGSVAIDSVSGDVSITSVEGDVAIDSAAGDVALSTVEGATTIAASSTSAISLGNTDTASGDVTITSAGTVSLINVDEVTLSSVSSTTIDTASSVDLTSAQSQDSITLTSVETVTGDITASTSAGIDVGTVSGAISVETVAGDVEIDSVSGAVAIDSVAGDLAIDSAESDVTLGTVSGASTITGAEDSAISVVLGDAETASGDVAIDNAESVSLRNVGEVELTSVSSTAIDTATSVDMTDAGEQTSIALANIGTVIGDLVSTGDLSLSDLSLESTATASTITIAGEVTSSADNFNAAEIANTGDLILTGGDLNTAISGTGSVSAIDTTISADVTASTLSLSGESSVGEVTIDSDLSITSGSDITLTSTTVTGLISVGSDSAAADSETSLSIESGTFYSDIVLGSSDNEGSVSLTIGGDVEFVAGEDGEVVVTVDASEAAGETSLTVTSTFTNDDDEAVFNANITGVNTVVLSGDVVLGDVTISGIDSLTYPDVTGDLDVSLDDTTITGDLTVGSAEDASESLSLSLSGTTVADDTTVTVVGTNKDSATLSLSETTLSSGSSVSAVDVTDIEVGNDNLIETDVAISVGNTDINNVTTVAPTEEEDASGVVEFASENAKEVSKTAYSVETDTTVLGGEISTSYVEHSNNEDITLTAISTTTGIIHLDNNTTVSAEIVDSDGNVVSYGTALTNDPSDGSHGLKVSLAGSTTLKAGITANSPLVISSMQEDYGDDITSYELADAVLTVEGGVITTNYTADSDSDITIDKGVTLVLTTNEAGTMASVVDSGAINIDEEASVEIAATLEMLVGESYTLLDETTAANNNLDDLAESIVFENGTFNYLENEDKGIDIEVATLSHFEDKATSEGASNNVVSLARSLDAISTSDNAEDLKEFKSDMYNNENLDDYIMNANSYMTELNATLLSNMNFANTKRARVLLKSAQEGVVYETEDSSDAANYLQGMTKILPQSANRVAQLQSINLLGSKDSSNGVAGYDYWSVGSTANIDFISNDKALVGFSLGGTYNKVSGDAGDNANSKNFLLNFYGALTFDSMPLELFANIGYAHAWNESSSTGSKATASSEWDSNSINALGGLVYNIKDVSEGLTISPMIMLNTVFIANDEAKVTGNTYASTIDSDIYYSIKTVLGVEALYELSDNLDASLNLMWTYELGDNSYDMSYTINNMLSGVDYLGGEAGRSACVLGFGLSYDLSEMCSAYFDYTVYLYKAMISHSLNLSVALKF